MSSNTTRKRISMNNSVNSKLCGNRLFNEDNYVKTKTNVTYITKSAKYENDIRVELFRKWANTDNPVAVISNFPSTANADIDDTTIFRTYKILKYNGFSQFTIYNVMVSVPEIREKIIVVCWGNALDLKEGRKVIEKLRDSGKNIVCFGVNKNGSPKMPTRLPYNTQVINYQMRY